MKHRIVTPVSLLLKDIKNYKKVSRSSDFFELRHHFFSHIDKKKVLFYHSEYQLNHPLNAKDFIKIKNILSIYKNIKFISFHIASCFKDPKINKFNIFIPGSKKISRRQMIKNAIENVKKIKKHFPKVKILAENNNYYNTGAYDFVCDSKFINELVTKSNIYFLFDLSHFLISAYNLKISLEKYIFEFPLEKILQIHLSRPVFKNDMFLDKHYLPNINDFEKKLITKLNPKYVTIEYYKDVDKLILINKKILKIFKK